MTQQRPSATKHEQPHPPIVLNANGERRRVGVELELSGVGLEAIAETITRRFGGDIEPVSDYELVVADTPVGDFRVELDFQYLKELGRDEGEATGITDELRRLSEETVAEIARHVVPLEIVSPPLDLDRLTDLDALVADLRAMGARGTRHSPIYAFGLHLNPEVTSLDATDLLRYLRAFLCAYDWLVNVESVDWSRRVTPYINPFPNDYVIEILDEQYRPDGAQLIDDYLVHNADRNRALDLLPLFAFVDEERVRAAIDDPRIKARPTFHYRLPNCDVDIEGWRVSAPWHNWLAVERLAEDPERLQEMSAAYRRHLGSRLPMSGDDWLESSRRWIE